MTSTIVVNEPFERHWSFAADHAAERWSGPDLHFVRLDSGDQRTLAELDLPVDTQRLLVLSTDLELGDGDLAHLPLLKEAAFADTTTNGALVDPLRGRGIHVYLLRNECYWGQSVAEFALGLTISALRRIPQTYRAMLDSHNVWNYLPEAGLGRPGARAAQSVTIRLLRPAQSLESASVWQGWATLVLGTPRSVRRSARM